MMIQKLSFVLAEIHDCVGLHAARKVQPALEITNVNVGRKSSGTMSA